MENTFSFNRFRILIIKHAVENWKRYVIYIIVMTILIYFSNGPRISKANVPFFENYVFIMILIGALYSGMFFKKWTDKTKGSNYLMLPATITEKIALVFFYTIIVFVPLYTGLFYLEMYVQTRIYYPDAEVVFIGQTGEHSPLYAFLTKAIVPYVFLQSLFLLFQIWFKKRQTIRILIYFYCSIFFVTICNGFYIEWISGSRDVFVDEKFVLFPISITYSGSMVYDLFTSPFIAAVSIPVIILLTVLIYVAAYFKLKEKEI